MRGWKVLLPSFSLGAGTVLVLFRGTVLFPVSMSEAMARAASFGVMSRMCATRAMRSKLGVDGLSQLVAKGVRVRILTNSLTSIDHGIVHAHYAKYRKALLERGIELHEIYDKRTMEYPNGEKSSSKIVKANMLHGKTFVFDRQSVFIGSLNMDPRSWTENTEMGGVYESEELSRRIAKWFDNNVDRVA